MIHTKYKKIINEIVKLYSISITGSLFTLFLLFISLTFIFSLGDKIIVDLFYDIESINNEDDIVIKIVSDDCQTQDNDLKKIRCIRDYYKKYFFNNKHNGIQSVSESFNNGGVCRDATVYYCATLNKLNISCRSVTIDEHIFAVADLKEGQYCILDMNQIWCR